MSSTIIFICSLTSSVRHNIVHLAEHSLPVVKICPRLIPWLLCLNVGALQCQLTHCRDALEPCQIGPDGLVPILHKWITAPQSWCTAGTRTGCLTPHSTHHRSMRAAGHVSPLHCFSRCSSLYRSHSLWQWTYLSSDIPLAREGRGTFSVLQWPPTPNCCWEAPCTTWGWGWLNWTCIESIWKASLLSIFSVLYLPCFPKAPSRHWLPRPLQVSAAPPCCLTTSHKVLKNDPTTWE